MPVTGAAGELGGLDAGFLEDQGRLGPGGGVGWGRGPAGVGGVRGLVGQDSPGGGVPVAVGGAGGVGGAGVDAEAVAVQLDAGQGRDEASGGALAGAGGAGDDQVVAAGDRRYLLAGGWCWAA